MRKLTLWPSTDRSIGELLALAHALYVGMWLRWEFDGYFSGVIPDLNLHGFYYLAVDLPILYLTIILKPLGLGYRAGDVWSYALTDTFVMIFGTLYWFASGYFAMRLLRAAGGGTLPAWIRARQWVGLKTVRLLFLTVVLLYLLSTTRFSNGIVTTAKTLCMLALYLAVPVGATMELLRLFRTQRQRRQTPGS